MHQNVTDPVPTVRHLATDELDAGLDGIRQAPKDDGVLELIVRRPAVNGRERLDEGELSVADGLVGDNWKARPSSRTMDRSPHPDMQLNVMSSRVVVLVSQSRDRWSLAGDQLFVDLDVSHANLPAGTRLAMGEAIIEVTSQPHNGCHKFVERFGRDAVSFVNYPVGKALRMRGLNARVVQPGRIRVGDRVRKLPRQP